MKTRLPRILFISLLSALGTESVSAAVRHTDVSLQTYVDFATNSGRYVAEGSTNAMLDYIRKRDGGVKIEYTGGQESYTLEHQMISFDSVADMGNVTAVGYNYIVTVAHNANQLYPTFTGNDYGIGAAKSIKYVTVDEDFDALIHKSFVHHIYSGDNDYKVARLTKLVTDVTPAQMTGGAGSDYKGQLVYRVGGGLNYLRDDKGDSDRSYQGTYLMGGIAQVTDWSASTDELRHGNVIGTTDWTPGKGAGASTPLPFGSEQGDSGSPYFVWEGDAETGSYKFLMAHRGSNNNNKTTQSCEALEWTQTIMQNDSFCVDMGQVQGALKIQGAEVDPVDGPVWSDTYKAEVYDSKTQSYVEVEQTFEVRVAQAFLADADGMVQDKNWNAYFLAVETGKHTWNTLSDLKNKDTWYAYGNEYLNAKESVTLDDDNNAVVTEGLTYAKLFKTQNLVLEAAADGASYQVDVTQDTDLGAGYLHFAANGKNDVQFELKSEKNNLLNSAGYVVDEGVQVNVTLRNADSSYMREWRKVGEGILNICGSDKNEIFLNVGGKGLTLLNQEKGYAAYNVLVNTGSTVKIKNTDQIYRDLTFGNGGGTLDMNGNSMAWYLTKGEDRGGFTINALTEEAIISNSSATKAVLTFREENNQNFVGSFQDSATSALGIVYDGKGTWELNSIRTQLKHADSGLTVMSGTVKLAGTPTVHGYGTVHTEYTADFSTRADDWHYADATMNVTVEKDATFELAGHARLIGDVTVKDGGTYLMREGVNHAEEYIEGGEKKESTGGEVAKYYGHWGDVKLEENSEMLVAYTAGTDTATRYTGKVSGPGKITVDLGTDAAAFALDGEVSGVESVDVVGKSKLELGSNVTIAELQSGNASFTKVYTMNKDVMSGSEEDQLSMKNVYMVVTAGKTYTISHAKVEGSYIDAKEGSTLKLSDVYVAAGTYLTDAPATLVADDTTLQVVVGTNATAQALTLGGALIVEAPGGADKATVAATDKVLQITSSIMDTFAVTGSLLTIDLTGSEWSFDGTALTLNGEVVGDWIALSFDTDDKSAASFDKNLAVKLTFSGVEALADVSLTGYYNVAEAAPTTVYFQTRYVPEPTTTTLSLLALAALCARRRRKEA